MAVSTQTVIINVVVRGGGSQQVLNQLGLGGQKVGHGISHANTALSRFIGTLTKALISMAGVLVAFNLFVTLPQAIARSLLAMAAAMVKAGEEMSKLTLQTAGLLASFAQFGETTAESFENAIRYSRRLQFTFAELAAKSLATAEDMQKGFQVFVARGGLAFVAEDMDKAAKTAAFLTDLTIAFTGELQKERQIYTEIDALMQGQARAGAVIARLLKAQVGDLEAYLDRHRKQGDLLEDLQRRFSGIAEASSRLGQTLTGMLTSITGSAKILNDIAYREGALPVIQQMLAGWRDLLVNATKELGRFNKETKTLSAETASVVRAFAALNTAIIVVVESAQRLIYYLAGARSEAEFLEKLALQILKIGVLAETFFEALVIYPELNRVNKEMLSVIGNMEKLQPKMKEYIDLLSKVVFDKAIMDRLYQLNAKLVALLNAGYEKNRKEIVDTAQELFNLMAKVTPKLNPITGPLEVMKGAYNVNIKEAEKMASAIVEAIQRMLASADEFDAKWQSINSTTEETSRLIERAEREIIKLTYTLESLRARGYPLLQLQIEQNEQAALLKDTYAALPEHLKIMLDLNKQITEEKIKQARQDAARDITEDLIDRLMAARASYSEFAAADARAFVEAREISEKLRGFGEGLIKVTTDLKGSVAGLADAAHGLKVPTVEVAAPFAAPTEPTGVRETLDALASITAEINTAGSRAIDIENALVRLGRERLLYGRDQNNVVRDVNLQLLQQVVYAELLSEVGEEIAALSLSKILEEGGELAELEERRSRQLRALNSMVTLEVEQKRALITLLNMQFDLEAEILMIRRDAEMSKDLLDRFRTLEKMKGEADELREVEVEHAAEVAKIHDLYKNNTSLLKWALWLEQERYRYALRRAEVERFAREADIALDRTRAAITNIREGIENYARFAGSLDEAAARAAALRQQIAENNALIAEFGRQISSGTLKGDALKIAEDRIRALSAANREAALALDPVTLGFDILLATMDRASYAVIAWGQRTISTFEMVKAVAEGFAATLVQNLGPAIAEMFQAFFEGESVLKSFAKFVGRMLVMMGTQLVNFGLGEIALAMTVFGRAFGASVAAGLKAIAVGVMLIAAGAALGAGGGKGAGAPAGAAETKEVQPYWVRNQDVAAQQGIQYVLGENTRAINRLNNEVSRLSKETGDTLVTRAIERNPSSVVKPVTGAIARSYELQNQLGGAAISINT